MENCFHDAKKSADGMNVLSKAPTDRLHELHNDKHVMENIPEYD